MDGSYIKPKHHPMQALFLRAMIGVVGFNAVGPSITSAFGAEHQAVNPVILNKVTLTNTGRSITISADHTIRDVGTGMVINPAGQPAHIDVDAAYLKSIGKTDQEIALIQQKNAGDHIILTDGAGHYMGAGPLAKPGTAPAPGNNQHQISIPPHAPAEYLNTITNAALKGETAPTYEEWAAANPNMLSHTHPAGTRMSHPASASTWAQMSPEQSATFQNTQNAWGTAMSGNGPMTTALKSDEGYKMSGGGNDYTMKGWSSGTNEYTQQNNQGWASLKTTMNNNGNCTCELHIQYPGSPNYPYQPGSPNGPGYPNQPGQPGYPKMPQIPEINIHFKIIVVKHIVHDHVVEHRVFQGLPLVLIPFVEASLEASGASLENGTPPSHAPQLPPPEKVLPHVPHHARGHAHGLLAPTGCVGCDIIRKCINDVLGAVFGWGGTPTTGPNGDVDVNSAATSGGIFGMAKIMFAKIQALGHQSQDNGTAIKNLQTSVDNLQASVNDQPAQTATATATATAVATAISTAVSNSLVVVKSAVTDAVQAGFAVLKKQNDDNAARERHKQDVYNTRWAIAATLGFLIILGAIAGATARILGAIRSLAWRMDNRGPWDPTTPPPPLPLSPPPRPSGWRGFGWLRSIDPRNWRIWGSGSKGRTILLPPPLEPVAEPAMIAASAITAQASSPVLAQVPADPIVAQASVDPIVAQASVDPIVAQASVDPIVAQAAPAQSAPAAQPQTRRARAQAQAQAADALRAADADTFRNAFDNDALKAGKTIQKGAHATHAVLEGDTLRLIETYQGRKETETLITRADDGSLSVNVKGKSAYVQKGRSLRTDVSAQYGADGSLSETSANLGSVADVAPSLRSAANGLRALESGYVETGILSQAKMRDISTRFKPAAAAVAEPVSATAVPAVRKTTMDFLRGLVTHPLSTRIAPTPECV